MFFEEKLKRAEEQRQLMLREKIRKAQEEEAKVGKPKLLVLYSAFTHINVQMHFTNNCRADS